jgi:hypothetical protein
MRTKAKELQILRFAQDDSSWFGVLIAPNGVEGPVFAHKDIPQADAWPAESFCVISTF